MKEFWKNLDDNKPNARLTMRNLLSGLYNETEQRVNTNLILRLLSKCSATTATHVKNVKICCCRLTANDSATLVINGIWYWILYRPANDVNFFILNFEKCKENVKKM